MASTVRYATVAELKARLVMVGSNATQDAVLGAMLDAASRAIDNLMRRRRDGFVAGAASARQFVGNGATWLMIDEAAAAPTLVEVKDGPGDTTWRSLDADDWIVARGDPQNPVYGQTPYTLLIATPYGAQGYFPGGHLVGSSGPASWAFMGRDYEYDMPRGGIRGVGFPTVRVTAAWGFDTVIPDVNREACVTQAARWWKRAQSSWADAVGDGNLGTILYRKELDPDIKMMLQQPGYTRRAI